MVYHRPYLTCLYKTELRDKSVLVKNSKWNGIPLVLTLIIKWLVFNLLFFFVSLLFGRISSVSMFSVFLTWCQFSVTDKEQKIWKKCYKHSWHLSILILELIGPKSILFGKCIEIETLKSISQSFSKWLPLAWYQYNSMLFFFFFFSCNQLVLASFRKRFPVFQERYVWNALRRI